LGIVEQPVPLGLACIVGVAFSLVVAPLASVKLGLPVVEPSLTPVEFGRTPVKRLLTPLARVP
jgi:hypothetical protein